MKAKMNSKPRRFRRLPKSMIYDTPTFDGGHTRLHGMVMPMFGVPVYVPADAAELITDRLRTLKKLTAKYDELNECIQKHNELTEKLFRLGTEVYTTPGKFAIENGLVKVKDE